jgi:hypothetical protein
VKNKNILILGFLLSAFIISCSQSEREEVSKNKNLENKPLILENVPHQDKSKIKIKQESEKNQVKPLLSYKKTISLNGEKYLFEDEKLQKGSQVRNIHMSEKGKIRGTFVVITKTGKIADISFKSKTKIAKDTFRLIPMQNDDLLDIYKMLLADKNLIRVEIEIDYSPESKKKLFK